MAFVRAKREELPEGVGGAYFNLGNYKGQVLAFEVLLIDEQFQNPRFPADPIKPAVKANVTVITGPDRGVLWEREWIVAEVLVRTLRGTPLGDTYVGKLYKGNAYSFNEISDEEYADAEALLLGGTAKPKAKPEGEAHSQANAEPPQDDEPPF